jgi:hypothetical protein
MCFSHGSPLILSVAVSGHSVYARRQMLRVWIAALGLVLTVPALELIAHALIVTHVPADDDYQAAAEFIRSQFAPRDLITAAPGYIDPLLRLHLGDRISPAMAGRSDDAAYERIWVVSARGALPKDAPKGKPELEQAFGRLRVLRWKLGKSRLLMDFVQNLPAAEVSMLRNGSELRCPRRTGGLPRGGGLGRPVLMPIAERFECDARQPWLFVGSIVMEDLSNAPRFCVWQHPQGDDPIRVRFDDVPLGDELVFYGGVYYEHERMREGGPIEVDISIDGQRRGGMTHHDGDGWRREVISSGSSEGQRGRVQIDVRAANTDKRSFCWAASTRRKFAAVSGGPAAFSHVVQRERPPPRTAQ